MALIMAAYFESPVSARADEVPTQAQEKSRVLLVCDENNGRAGLIELIRASGKSVDAISEANYQPSSLSGYSALVTTINPPYKDAVKAKIPTVCIGESAGPVDGVNTVYLQSAELRLGLGGYTQTEFAKEATACEMPKDGSPAFGSLTRSDGKIYPFAVITKSAAYVPWYNAEALSSVMLGGLFRQYFDSAVNSGGKMYVLIDEVYPFSDLDMLIKTADELSENDIPFIVRIMPVYDNLNYPAFERFTQALSYAQSNGGSIVLHDPIVREYEAVREPLDKKMARAKTAFADAGITLIDMSLPPLTLNTDDVQNINAPGKIFGNLPVDTMISVSLPADEDELLSTVGRLNDLNLSILSYKANFSIKDSVYVEKQIDSSFAFRALTVEKLKGFFTGANKILLIAVGLGLGIFALLLIIGNRIYWRKFYRK